MNSIMLRGGGDMDIERARAQIDATMDDLDVVRGISFALRSAEQSFPQVARELSIRLGCWDYKVRGEPSLNTTTLADGTVRASVTFTPGGPVTRAKWRHGKGWHKHVRRTKAAERRAR